MWSGRCEIIHSAVVGSVRFRVFYSFVVTRVAAEHINTPVAPRSAWEIYHFAVYLACEFEYGDKVAIRSYFRSTEKFGVIIVEVEISTCFRVCCTYPRCIADIVFVVPIHYFHVAVSHQFINLIFVWYSPFAFPEFVSHHVVFRSGDVTVDSGVWILSIYVCLRIITLFRTGNKRCDGCYYSATVCDVWISRFAYSACFFVKHHCRLVVFCFQFTPGVIVAAVKAGVKFTVHKVFFQIAVCVIPFAASCI